MPTETRERPHPAAVVALVVLVGLIALALATSERSGTGARDVGVRDGSSAVAAVTGTACPASVTTPGGRNNYRPDAPATPVLGRGLVITGTVRGTDCRPIPGVRVQVWTQTATAGEKDNRASAVTAADGTFRVDSDPPRAQFGEPNVHVAYDDEAYRPVFLRNVVRADDTLAVVDLTLVAAR